MNSCRCDDCGIVYETQSELANHKNKFCVNSKYGGIEQLQRNYGEIGRDRDISKFGKMALELKGRTYDFEANRENTNAIENEYKSILQQIEQEKNVRNRVEAQKQKAFRQLQALEKQQQQLVIEDKRANLVDIVAKRHNLARQEQQLERQIRAYNQKKKQWDKSAVRNRQKVDLPYQQGIVAGKLTQERSILEDRRREMQAELNAKKREKQKLERSLLNMSDVKQIPQPPTQKIQASKAISRLPYRSANIMKVPEQNLSQPPNSPTRQIDYSRLNNPRPPTQYSQASKASSYLAPALLNGTQKILKFNLNKEGKSQQDKVIESIMAQQYDDLLIISKLPKDSQLYNVKMKQYVELSKHRMHVQERAQKQRIEKMKRQFQFEKTIIDKQQENTKWVNENRKAFLAQQMELLKQTRDPPIDHNQLMSNVVSRMPPADNRNPSMMSNKPPQGLQSQPYQPRQRPKKADPFGYKISIITLRNYSLKKAIKIKLLAYEQFYHEKDIGMKHQFSTNYHYQNSGPSQDPFNPQFKNRLDQTGAIAYNQSFYIAQNLQQLYNRNQKQIYLLLIAAEKDEKMITNQPKPYCWYSFKLTHFGQIKQGRFTVNLYGDEIIYPLPADMNKMKKKKQEELTFQIQQIVMDEHLQNSINNSTANNLSKNSQNNVSVNNSMPAANNSAKNNNASLSNMLSGGGSQGNNGSAAQNSSMRGNTMPNSSNELKTNMNYPIKMKNLQESEIKQVKQEYFYSNQKQTEFSHVKLKKILNFDVSVSGLRTLPSYIGPIKLQLSFIDADGSNVLPRQQFLADIGTDLYNPLVHYTRKIRNQAKIPPSTLIFIRMIAISALDYQVYSLGFSLIYLFLDHEGSPITSNKTPEYLMTSGYYQLPIFWGNIQPQYIPVESLLTEYPTIPCSSILIGILQNASNISNPMPAYSQKIYNTILFQIDENQAKLFAEQYKREPIDTNMMISGYLQYKGIKKNYSGEEIGKYLYKTLTFGQARQRLQLKWMAEYQEYFGINFIIDKLNVPQTKEKYYYFVTVCISPPGNYYKKKSFDLNFCRKVNFQLSTSTQLCFLDNQFFINPRYYVNSSLIIEINRIQIFQTQSSYVDPNIQGFAYGIVPLFEIQEKIRSVNACKQTVALLEGDFDVNSIDKLQKNVQIFLERTGKAKGIASLDIRILNGYFMNQYKPQLPVIEAKTKMYKDIGGGRSFEPVLKEVGAILSSNYNLQLN